MAMIKNKGEKIIKKNKEKIKSNILLKNRYFFNLSHLKNIIIRGRFYIIFSILSSKIKKYFYFT